MNGFRQWLSRLMIGRYGNDELNRLLLIAAAVLIIIGIFVPRHWLNVVVVIILAIVYARMFSRNIPKRQEENRKYLELTSRFTGGRGASARPGQGGAQGSYGAGGSGGPARPARAKKQKVAEGKRIYICPHCKGSLQVPVGAGKIRITCPHCGNTFEEIV